MRSFAAGSSSRFQRCYATIPAGHKATSQPPKYIVHRVRRGQTLSQIARLYGTSVKEIQRRNGLRGKSPKIRAGQRLTIPKG